MEKYFSGDLLLAKTLKFLKNLSFGINFKQHNLYKINTHKINGARKIRSQFLLKAYNDQLYTYVCVYCFFFFFFYKSTILCKKVLFQSQFSTILKFNFYNTILPYFPYKNNEKKCICPLKSSLQLKGSCNNGPKSKQKFKQNLLHNPRICYFIENVNVTTKIEFYSFFLFLCIPNKFYRTTGTYVHKNDVKMHTNIHKKYLHMYSMYVCMILYM